MQQGFSLSDLSVDRFMTLASSSISSISSLSDASSSYLRESLVPKLPGPLQATAHRFATAVAYICRSEIPSSLDQLALLFETYVLASPTTVAVTLLTLILTVVVTTTTTTTIMSWRNPLGLWRRASPYGKPSSSQPQVSDSDFSYLTTNDIEEPEHAYDPVYIPRQSPRINESDDLAPDIITLKHRGVTYPLHFPAYTIGDGVVTIGDIRLKTGRATGADDLRRVKLLYKGRLLKDDSKPAKDVGIKQESELMCVVSECAGGSSSESEDSDLLQPISSSAQAQNPPPQPKKSQGRKGKGKKGKNKGSNQGDTNSSTASSPNLAPPPNTSSSKTTSPKVPSPKAPSPNLAPPGADNRPSSSASPSPSPSLQPFQTSREKIDALKNYWRSSLVPPIERYISRPPADKKTRDYEHKLLSEMTMTQVILKADGIEPDGDEVARSTRRALIVEIQGFIKRLDEAAKS
jgi:hypothetical protein